MPAASTISWYVRVHNNTHWDACTALHLKRSQIEQAVSGSDQTFSLRVPMTFMKIRLNHGSRNQQESTLGHVGGPIANLALALATVWEWTKIEANPEAEKEK